MGLGMQPPERRSVGEVPPRPPCESRPPHEINEEAWGGNMTLPLLVIPPIPKPFKKSIPVPSCTAASCQFGRYQILVVSSLEQPLHSRIAE